MNYKWIGGNTNVVIIGDIIDGSRSNSVNEKYIDSVHTTIHDYHQIEIKILRFINALQIQAQHDGGNIHKLLGNHEVVNILAIPEYKDQTFKRLQRINKYIINRTTGKSESRTTTFQHGGEGYNLLFENQIGLLLKINNNIFVHGSLRPIPIERIKEINNQLNNLENNTVLFNRINKGYTPETNNILFNEIPQGSDNLETNEGLLLWGRHYGSNIKQYDKMRYDDNVKEIINCKGIEYDLKILMGDSVDTSNYHVIVGHCIQLDMRKIDTTFTQQESVDDVSEKMSGVAGTGQIDPDKDRYFGITMNCQNTDGNYKVYRVDVGSSRAQDYNNLEKNLDNIRSKNDEKKYLYSRTPQVLEIIDNKFSIIRSLLENTRKNLPRPAYEQWRFRKNPPGEKIDYEFLELNKKYLKYKTK